jgi:hypothetical protein
LTWVHLDLAVRGRPRNQEEGEAAAQLIAWIEAGEIVLPFSSAPVDELDKQTSVPRRRLLGETMLRLSRSWKKISPRIARQSELTGALVQLGEESTAAEIGNLWKARSPVAGLSWLHGTVRLDVEGTGAGGPIRWSR